MQSISLARCPATWAGCRLFFIKPATCWMEGVWNPFNLLHFCCFRLTHNIHIFWGVEPDCWFSLVAVQTRVARGWRHVARQKKENICFFQVAGFSHNEGKIKWEKCHRLVMLWCWGGLKVYCYWFVIFTWGHQGNLVWLFFCLATLLVFPDRCFTREIQKTINLCMDRCAGFDPFFCFNTMT